MHKLLIAADLLPPPEGQVYIWVCVCDLHDDLKILNVLIHKFQLYSQ